MSNSSVNELGFDDHQEVNGRRNGLNAPRLNTNDILGPASKVSKAVSEDNNFGRIESVGLQDENPVRQEVTSLFQQAARSGLLNRMVEQVNKDLPKDHVAERVGCVGSRNPSCAFQENHNDLSIVFDGDTQVDGQSGVRLALQIDRKLGSVPVKDSEQTKPLQESQVADAAEKLKNVVWSDSSLIGGKQDELLAAAAKGNRLQQLIDATNKLMAPQDDKDGHRPRTVLEVLSDGKSVVSISRTYPDHIELSLPN